MQSSKKKLGDVTPEEVADFKEFERDKANHKTKVSSLEELIKELHE